jgi:O-antigen/teichoic acid export membrane protein
VTDETGRSVDTLRARVVRGAAWKLASQLFVQASRIAVAVVLARLLAPHDYGIAGMVLAFSALVYIFSDVALGAALVQRRDLTERDRSTAFWTSLFAGSAFTVVGVLLADPIARFYGEPEVAPLFVALSFSFVVTALGTTQRALLTRDLDFRRLELRMIGATAAGAAVGLGAAAAGFGAWAIIGQQVTIAVASTALLWMVSPWRPTLAFSLASLRSLGGFSGNVFGTRVLFYVSRTADNILIGRFLGAPALGAYAMAYNVMLTPIDRLAGPIQEVLFPAFSRIQDDARRVGEVWLRVNRLVAAIAMPAMAGTIVVADDLVRVVLGSSWASAVPVIQILAWVGVLQSLQRLNSSILQARDRTRTLLGFAAGASAANVAAFAIGLQWGIVGVATAYAIANTLLQPVYTAVTARAVDVTFATCVRNVSHVAQATLAMTVVLVGARIALLEVGMSRPGRLALLSLLGIAAYALACFWRAPELVAEIGALRRRRVAAAVRPVTLPDG